MKNLNVLLAGFGGQGVLFAGKVAAYVGMLLNKEISWLPSYGPEMRGGTANCTVCISDEEIGAPNVPNPNAFVVMNLPSFDKFIDDVETGGTVVIDSSLVNKKVKRKDLNVFYIPASEIAEKNDIPGLANIVLISKLVKEMKIASMDILDKAIEHCVPKARQIMLEMNKKAARLGACMA